ncbi:MAG: glycosyltransferase, partial [Candidatus Aenigmarchaeota archaeon]|nr:glycosyltransferase [Candidatus Aenigmarchaeota archaeon]
KETSSSKEVLLYSDCFQTSNKDSFETRLKQIGEEIQKIIEKYNPENKILICFVGRLLEVKGVKYLIQAVKMIDKEIQKKIKILIVGDGTLRIELETLTKNNNLNEIVEFTGHKSQEECNQIMQISDIFILPSISEGLPLAVLEAMANKCALIVTDIGLPVKNKKDGLVVTPKNPKEIKNAIELLTGNKDLREELSKNAFEKVKKEYTWETAVEKYLKIIE